MARTPIRTTAPPSPGMAGLGTVAGGTIGQAPADRSGGALSNLFGSMLGIFRPPPVSPYQQAGRPGTAVWGGYVENIEKDRKLAGRERYRTASDILANVSIVAAGLRFYLNLASVPTWTVKPAEDLGPGKSSDEAKKMAEFGHDIINGMDTSWSRIVRRSGMYRFHGFTIQEWIAKRRPDGLIGMADVKQRPQHTIERWELADDATILGMWQRWPQNGELLYLPRQKVMYIVDDMFTDSPEGLGLFRHLVDPSERVRRYLQMESMGYERDMRGLPVGRAPLAELNAQLQAGVITKEQHEQAVSGIRNFITMQVKEQDSAIMLDSQTYNGTTADGVTVSTVNKWGVELLSNDAGGFEMLGKAIDRLNHDMARILGVESLLLGGQGGGSGSKALSQDKSRNLYLSVNSTNKDIAESGRRDLIGAAWWLNGLDEKLMPTLETADVAFKDVEAVAKALSDMATAGAILAPDDPAINDMRDLLGISRQPDGQADAAAETALLPRVTPPKSGAIQPGGAAPPPAPAGPPKPGPKPAPTAGGRNRGSSSTPK